LLLGRIARIGDLPLHSGRALVSQSTSAILTDAFKTSSTFGFQAIIIPDWLKPYIERWLDCLRPAILATLEPHLAQTLTESTAPMWCSASGGKINPSALISAFFREKLGLNLTR
jgi:hypothetical protein